MDLETLEKVESVGSKLEKERLLGLLKEDTLVFLRWALDPMITFGVTVDTESLTADIVDFEIHPGQLSVEQFWIEFDKLCGELARRDLTGNSATSAIERLVMNAPAREDAIWACRILNKDLRSGFSMSTLNKAHPGCIEKEIPAALAKPYDPEKHEIRGAWRVEPKLDGLRMVVVNGVAYTRNGRTIDSVGHVLKELEPFKDTHVFDGEIMGETNFDEDSGKIRKKGMGPNLSLKYNMFDCMTIAEWQAKKTRSYEERRASLLELWNQISAKNMKVVPSVPVNDPTSEELFKVRDEMIAMGYEGAMLKDASSPYIFKRSDAILKLKEFTDADGIITGYFEGKGRHKGRLGGVIATFDGVPCRVGSGFSDKQRDELWAIRETLAGKCIEVQYQNKTEDGCLRFPVFIKFRPDRDPL